VQKGPAFVVLDEKQTPLYESENLQFVENGLKIHHNSQEIILNTQGIKWIMK
jgi:hypothetical protein